MITRNQANVSKCTNFLGALTSSLLVSFQEVAELGIVQPLLLLDRHNILQCLAEVLKMKVQVLLVC